MKWSKLQENIFDAIQKGDSNLFVNAGPGSGKTTTIVGAAKFAPPGSTFLAFNKKIAQELSTRLPCHVTASTMHKYGLDELRDRLPKFKIDGYKNNNLVKEKFPEWKEWAYPISQAISLAKGNGFGLLCRGDAHNWEVLLEHHDFEIPTGMEMGKFIHACQNVYKKSIEKWDVIDFDDMIYLPVMFNRTKGWEMDKVPLVFLDEAQDTNSLQARFIQLFATRLVAVGDPYQAIYGFRGAGVTALDDMDDLFQFEYLPLSISYRCPVSHVSLAKMRNPELEAAEDAIEGEIYYGHFDQVTELTDENTLVICRNNWPLFVIALQWLEKRKQFQMNQKFPKQLKSFLKGFKAKSISDLKEKMNHWWTQTKDELIKKDKLSLLARQEEKFRALYHLAQDSTDVGDCYAKLEHLMMANVGPCLFTVHGAKGLEADRVIILMPELIPSKYAQQGTWQYEQELNMRYVAETRAKQEIYYLSPENDPM